MSFGIPVRNGLGIGLAPSIALSSLRVGGRPALILNFIGTTALDSRVTFTRATTATFVGSNGLIQTAAIDAPRFGYDPTTLAAKGLLIEEARTNVCIQSADIDNAAWTRTGVVVVGDTITSPAGTTTGNTVTCSAGSSAHRVFSTAGVVTLSTTITHSVFVKAGTHSFFQIHDGSTATFYANFNLTAGTVTAVNPTNGATITPYGNGWYKCTLSLISSTTASIGVVAIIPDGASLRNPTWTATGTESIYAWGYQIETGAFATSYIPTTTVAVLRSADVATMTSTNFSSWYNSTQGSFVTQFTPSNISATATVLDANDNTALESIRLRTVSADPFFTVTDNSVDRKSVV